VSVAAQNRSLLTKALPAYAGLRLRRRVMSFAADKGIALVCGGLQSALRLKRSLPLPFFIALHSFGQRPVTAHSARYGSALSPLTQVLRDLARFLQPQGSE